MGSKRDTKNKRDSALEVCRKDLEFKDEEIGKLKLALKAALDASPGVLNLRDRFALSALPGLAQSWKDFTSDGDVEDTARCAYIFADAMLVAREEG